MKFSSGIKNFFSSSVELIYSPEKGWERVNHEAHSFGRVFAQFLLPWLLLITMASMIGSYLQTIDKGFFPDVMIFNGTKTLLGVILSLGISLLVVNALIGTYKGTPNLSHATLLVFYSCVPFFMSTVIIELIPWLYILGLFSLYSFYIFIKGTPVILDIPVEKQSNFSTLSVSAILVVYLMTNVVVNQFFKAYWPLS